MSDTRLDQTEEAIIAYEVSDDALESAAGAGSKNAGSVTFFFCTALDHCPGP
jgi:hypothetical protein